MYRPALFVQVLVGFVVGACGDDVGSVDTDVSSPEVESPDVDASPELPQTPDADTNPEPNPLIGRVYVQALGVGWASYHFDDLDDVYISYANATTWRLDDDTPFPDKKPFTDVMFDIPGRRFFGTIDWSEPEGTTVGGGNRGWIYEMVFSDDYGYISGGSITAVKADGSTGLIQMFNGDVFYNELEP